MEDQNIEVKILVLNGKVYWYLKFNQNISLKEFRKNGKKEIIDDYYFLDNSDEIDPEFEEERTLEDIIKDDTNKNSQKKENIQNLNKKFQSEEILSQKKELPNEIDKKEIKGEDEARNNAFTKVQNFKVDDGKVAN